MIRNVEALPYIFALIIVLPVGIAAIRLVWEITKHEFQGPTQTIEPDPIRRGMEGESRDVPTAARELPHPQDVEPAARAEIRRDRYRATPPSVTELLAAEPTTRAEIRRRREGRTLSVTELLAIARFRERKEVEARLHSASRMLELRLQNAQRSQDAYAVSVEPEGVSFGREYASRSIFELSQELATRKEAERQRRAEELKQQAAERKEAEERRYLELTYSLRTWQEAHPAPQSQAYGVSPAGAEAWIRDWMTHMGAENARQTKLSGDDGIDVESRHFVAQVKHYTGSIPIASIREHIGVAATDPARRDPVFFTSGTYPDSAYRIAASANMALFKYDVTTARVVAMNARARLLATFGMNPKWWPEDEVERLSTEPGVPKP